MGYLFLNDYKKTIQNDNLNQIIGNDYSLITAVELDAIEEFSSYLKQKYDLASEFTNTSKYEYGIVRNAKDRIYLDADAYSASARYGVGVLCLYGGNIYMCSITIDTPEAFNDAHWSLLGVQYAIYFVTTPNPDWNYYTSYVKNQIVFWKNKNYTCLIDNTAQQPDLNSKYWGSGTVYSIDGTILPSDTTKYTVGDNRSQQTVSSIVDIVLYNLHSRIAPRNIPDLRVKRYDDTIKWLRNCAKGDDITANIARLSPYVGRRNRYGSALPKQNNSF